MVSMRVNGILLARRAYVQRILRGHLANYEYEGIVNDLKRTEFLKNYGKVKKEKVKKRKNKN